MSDQRRLRRPGRRRRRRWAGVCVGGERKSERCARPGRQRRVFFFSKRVAGGADIRVGAPACLTYSLSPTHTTHILTPTFPQEKSPEGSGVGEDDQGGEVGTGGVVRGAG
jgi:hypothetical protein